MKITKFRKDSFVTQNDQVAIDKKTYTRRASFYRINEVVTYKNSQYK